MSKEETRYAIEVSTRIDASIPEVWRLLVDPTLASELWWGSTVESDFVAGRPIVWKGVWEGKPFEDRGVILQVQAPHLLSYSHWTPSMGPDVEEKRNILTWRLSEENGGVRVVFQHENIATREMKEHSEPMWSQLLARMKELAEKSRQPR
ncbi:MAG TPA: SRPBCC domain-containing protein [Spirochaetia bacterium]|nr:SRPBCC domain-containing protein [Spirochaetia bacterium]